MEAFLCIATQMKRLALADGSVLVTGLDYQGAQAGLALAGVAVTPREWANVRIIEQGAVAAANEGRQ